MIWTSHSIDPEDPDYVNITIDGHHFTWNQDDLEWVRDMCIELAIHQIKAANE